MKDYDCKGFLNKDKNILLGIGFDIVTLKMLRNKYNWKFLLSYMY